MRSQFLGEREILALSGARHRNNLQIRALISQELNCFQTFLFGHDQIGDEKIRSVLAQPLYSLSAIGSFEHSIASALKNPAEEVADLVMIVNGLTERYGWFARHFPLQLVKRNIEVMRDMERGHKLAHILETSRSILKSCVGRKKRL